MRELRTKLEALKSDPSMFKQFITDLNVLLNSKEEASYTNFEVQIDELNQKFYDKLRDSYSGLTSNDLLLCAYIRTGLDSKEIARLSNINHPVCISTDRQFVRN